MANESFGRGEQVPERDAKAHAGHNFVAVLAVDGVFDGLCRGLAKVLRLDLDQVLDRALGGVST